MSLSVLQKTNLQGFPKPGELIEITGTHGLEASDRSILNRLYEHAHAAGNIAELSSEWEIELSKLRSSKHESNDRLKDSLKRLMQVVVSVPFIGKNGEPMTLMTHLFDFFEMPDDEAGASTIRFGLPRKLVPVLARSNRWGRIKAEVVCAMSSRYAIALYEMIQLRANMDRCVEVFPIDKFRALLGVPPGAYQRGNNLIQRVIEPAGLEVNGLSDMGVKMEVKRKSERSPIEAVVVAWHRKEGDTFREALRERERSKIGRNARLRGTAEAVVP
jgi:plasmid replication initiation protein